jgi:hypothetical protein
MVDDATRAWPIVLKRWISATNATIFVLQGTSTCMQAHRARPGDILQVWTEDDDDDDRGPTVRVRILPNADRADRERALPPKLAMKSAFAKSNAPAFARAAHAARAATRARALRASQASTAARAEALAAARAAARAEARATRATRAAARAGDDMEAPVRARPRKRPPSPPCWS